MPNASFKAHFKFNFKKEGIDEQLNVLFLSPAFEGSFVALVNSLDSQRTSQNIVHFSQSGSEKWYSLKIHVEEVFMLSDRDFILIDRNKRSIIWFNIVRGTFENCGHEFDPLSTEIDLFVFTETRMFCIYELKSRDAQFTYYYIPDKLQKDEFLNISLENILFNSKEIKFKCQKVNNFSKMALFSTNNKKSLNSIKLALVSIDEKQKGEVQIISSSRTVS